MPEIQVFASSFDTCVCLLACVVGRWHVCVCLTDLDVCYSEVSMSR